MVGARGGSLRRRTERQTGPDEWHPARPNWVDIDAIDLDSVAITTQFIVDTRTHGLPIDRRTDEPPTFWSSSLTDVVIIIIIIIMTAP